MFKRKVEAASEEEGNPFPFDSDLPTDTIHAVGSTANGIRSTVLREQRKGNEAASYVLFTNVPPGIVERSEDNPSMVGGKTARIFYDESLRRLIVKVPSDVHELAGNLLSREIELIIQPMGVLDELLPFGGARVKEGSYRKEPDRSWRPRTLPTGRSPKWPTLVVESGWSESLNRLRVDAEWWLTHSHGDVKVVILVKINRTQPKIIIETWILDPNSGILRPGPVLRGHRNHRLITMCSQVVTVSRDQQGTITTVGVPLTIKFDDIFLRPTVPPNERDIIVPEQALQSVAMTTWLEAGI